MSKKIYINTKDDPKLRFKNEKAITLMALIITIIILLILAMVSVRLVINNEIIGKTEISVERYREEEIGEQAKLAFSEWQLAKFDGESDSAKNFMEKRLKTALNNNNVSVTENNLFFTITVIYSGKTIVIKYDANTGKTGKYSNVFDFGSYTQNNIPEGETITLGTEKFMVLSNKNGVIQAVPYYNLKLNTTPIRQATKSEAEQGDEVVGTSIFSTSKYWANGETAINLNHSENKVYQYVTAYKNALENLGATWINVDLLDISKLRELQIENEEYVEMIEERCNPGKLGNYFTKSAHDQLSDLIILVNEDSIVGTDSTTFNNVSGVRPIITIY